MRQIIRFALAGAVILLTFASVTPAAGSPTDAPQAGTTITVTSTGDDTATNGNCTLREAIQAANLDRRVDRCPAGSGTDTIRLGERTYRMTRAGRVEDSNRTGDFDIHTSMNIVGAGMGKTFIDLGQVDRAFDVRATTASILLQDLTIHNGLTGDGNVPDHGGAVANRGTMTLRRVEFLHNWTTGIVNEMGGAVWNKGKMTITGSRFFENYSETYGGALGNSGALTVDATTFDENHGYVGGAIYNAAAGVMALNANSRFYRNHSGPGSGTVIFNLGRMTAKFNRYENNTEGDGAVIENYGTATVRYSTFKNNDTSTGVIISWEGSFTLSHSYLYNNHAIFPDYGLINAKGGTFVIDKSTIQGGTGTGLMAEYDVVKVVNSTFSNLSSSNCAGAICGLYGVRLTVESTTISGSRTSEGNPAFAAYNGQVFLHNTIITNTRNMDGSAYLDDCIGQEGVLHSQGYNLITRADGCMFAKTTGDRFGTAASPYPAGLAPLAMNGGRTPTHALTQESRARNAGDPAVTVKTDQRGYARPAGTRPDIGAYEFGAKAP